VKKLVVEAEVEQVSERHVTSPGKLSDEGYFSGEEQLPASLAAQISKQEKHQEKESD